MINRNFVLWFCFGFYLIGCGGKSKFKTQAATNSLPVQNETVEAVEVTPDPSLTLIINNSPVASGTTINITNGGNVSIGWSSSNTSSCSYSGPSSSSISANATNQSSFIVPNLTQSSSISVNCIGANGKSALATAKISVATAPLLASAQLQVNGYPTTAYLAWNSPIVLSWTVANVSSCSIDQGVGYVGSTNGSRNLSTNATSSITYTLTCQSASDVSAAGLQTSRVRVEIDSGTLPHPQARLLANGAVNTMDPQSGLALPISIAYNSQVNFTWNSEYTSGCSIVRSLSPTIPPFPSDAQMNLPSNSTSSNFVTLSNFTQNSIVTLFCNGTSEHVQSSIFLQIDPNTVPMTADLQISSNVGSFPTHGPLSLLPNATLTASWSTSHANSCSIRQTDSNGGSQTIDIPAAQLSTGSVTLTPTMAASTDYKLTCINNYGNSTLDAPPVTVNATPPVCATFYLDANYTGRSYSVVAWSAEGNYANPFNDNVSSIAVTPGCTVTVYEHANFGGWSNTYTSSSNAGDWTSSYKCSCNVPGVSPATIALQKQWLDLH